MNEETLKAAHQLCSPPHLKVGETQLIGPSAITHYQVGILDSLNNLMAGDKNYRSTRAKNMN